MFGKDKPDWKIEPVRVLSDSCVITIGNTQHNIHANEWVEILPVSTMSEYIALMHVGSLDNNPSAIMGAGGSFADLCGELANRIIDWNWTGMDSKPLPKPYRNPAAIKSLSAEEILWLVTATQGETGEQRKND